ncbi:MAG TPA: VCBS repeat-containing protein [Geothrix sp.]|nr:VCBS repeat-containing protein [Geothrix sp.]
MLTRSRLFFGALGMLALLGCSGSDAHYGPAYGEQVNGIAVADIDGNGLPDILGMVSTFYGDSATPGYVSTRLQTSSGAYLLPTRFGVGIGPANMVVTDVNGDGRPDLVVAAADDQAVTVRLADPSHPGYFLPAVVLATPGRTPLDVAVGDLDGDGKADIVVAASGANNVLVFLQGSTPGTFQAPMSLPTGGDPQAVTVADLDGDGHLDIAVATAANTVSILRQLVFSPTFAAQSSVDYPTGMHPVAIKAADLHGTGQLDLLTANWGADSNPNTQGLSVLSQTAPGVFAAPVHYATDYRATALAVGDLNGDGHLDVAVACEGLPGASGAVSVFLQDATTAGSLLAPTNYPGTWGPMGVAIADLDGDGHPDLVLADGGIVVRFNVATAPGTFGPRTYFYN